MATDLSSNGHSRGQVITLCQSDRIVKAIEKLEARIEDSVNVLVEKATDSNRVDISIVQTQLRDYRIVLIAGLALSACISIFTVLWFTGIEPYLQAKDIIVDLHKKEIKENVRN